MITYGLIGKVLGHSFSKDFFREKFSNEHIDAQYLNYEIPSIQDFPAIVRDNQTICGLNVTIPYKTEIIPYLHSVSDEARDIGAVNVVKVIRNQKGEIFLQGHNTDVIGFTKSIMSHIRPYHNTALILGTGGVSKAVHYALEKMNIKTIFVSRTKSESAITYSQIESSLINDAIIVNCTPLGMFPNVDTCPPIPYQLLNSRNLLFDCVYNPLTTLFLQKGATQGADILNGLSMLHIQAIEAWHIWTN